MRVLVIDNYDSFVYNLVQYLGQLGADSVVRRNDEISVDDIPGIGAACDPALPRPGHSAARRNLSRRDPPVRRRPADLRCLPRPSGVRRGVRSDRPARARATAREGVAGPPRRPRRAGRSARSVHRDALSLARGRRVDVAVRDRGHRPHRVRRRDGDATPYVADRRRPVPSGVGVDPGRSRDARELARRATDSPRPLDRAPALAAEVEARRLGAFAA